MSTKRRDNIAQLDSFILKLNTGQREDLIARQSPEDQEAIREALAQGKPVEVEEEKIAPPPLPEHAQEAVEGTDAAAKGKAEKKKEQVFRAEVAGRVAERKREEAAISATDRFAQKAFNLGNGVFHGSKGWLEARPTPGGIGVPLAILLFFFFLLLPVNGHTRLMWLWLTLTGNAELGGPLPAPTLTPQAPPTTATTPNNIVTGVEAAILTALNPAAAAQVGLQNLLGSWGQSLNPGNKTVGQNSPPVGTKKGPPIHPVGKNKPVTGLPGKGGGPHPLSNLNGHAQSYGDLLRSLED